MKRSEEAVRSEAESIAKEVVAKAGRASRVGVVLALSAFIGAAGVALSIIASPVGLAALAFGALFAGWAIRHHRLVAAMGLGSSAVNEADRGRFDVALAVLAILERQPGAQRLRQTALIQRASIALALGDAKDSRRLLDEALAAPATSFVFAEIHVLNGLVATALRGLVAALDGDDASAMRDANAARAAVRERRFGRGMIVNESLIGSVLARAALAEALVLSRSGGGDALATHLEAHRKVLTEGTTPRERTLYRGLVRLSRGRRRSAYREPPAEPVTREAPTPEAWVARFAPEVGALLDPSAPRPARREVEVVTPRSASVPVRPRATGLRAGARMVLLWALIATMFFAIWQLLDDGGAAPSRSPAIHVPAPPAEPSAWLTLSPLIFSVVFVGMFAWILASVARQARVMNETMCRLATGELTGLELEQRRMGENFVIKLMRSTSLSRASFIGSRFDQALAHADAAFAAVAHLRGRVAGEFHGMMSEARAAALAALGRGAEARGELTTWTPDFSRRTAGAIAVELLAAVREGDLDAADAIASRANDEISIDVRTEALRDLLRARRGVIGLVDRERLAEDVRQPKLRAFLEAVAPPLLADFERETTSETENEGEHEDEAEREQLAEADSGQADGPARRTVKASG